jgi:threonine aldolase
MTPSGTMANQSAIRAHTEPGDEVITHEGGHILHYETGAPAALSGVMIRPLRGERGQFTPDDVEWAVRPGDDHCPRSRLLIVENTHNRGGGAVWAVDAIREVTAKAAELGLKRHLDGARLWNACAAAGLAPDAYAAHFDTVSVCFSKGLGAPACSAVAGDERTIARVRRFRKMFGGTMRQSGLLAAAALYALENNRDRLTQDHDNAKRLAGGLADLGLQVDGERIETNMVFFTLPKALGDRFGQAPGICEAMERAGVRMLWESRTTIRAVTHLDVSCAMVDEALDRIKTIVSTG